jgi:hypothetical protein
MRLTVNPCTCLVRPIYIEDVKLNKRKSIENNGGVLKLVD